MSTPLKAEPIPTPPVAGELFRDLRKYVKWIVAAVIIFLILAIVAVVGGVILLTNLVLRPAIEQAPQLQQQGSSLLQQGQRLLEQYQAGPEQQQLEQVQQQLNQVQQLLEQQTPPVVGEGQAQPGPTQE